MRTVVHVCRLNVSVVIAMMVKQTYLGP